LFELKVFHQNQDSQDYFNIKYTVIASYKGDCGSNQPTHTLSANSSRTTFSRADLQNRLYRHSKINDINFKNMKFKKHH